MASDAAYMLNRDAEESKRLDTQHMFMRQLANGRLIQPSIPLTGIRAIADVATGTGIWLREAAQELTRSNMGIEFIGFDISPQQFPDKQMDHISFVVHDVTRPFPQEYHGRFDLVHVRLLSYALKAQDLETAVHNIVQILRPGGYLQWQEIDVIDSWAVPQTPDARSTVSCIISERVARGLTPAISTPLVKVLLSLSAPLPVGQVSPLCWTEDLLRIFHHDTFSTMHHPSPVVQAGTKQGIKATAVQLLQAGLSRRSALASQANLTDKSKQALSKDIETFQRLLEAWNNGTDPACNEWNFTMTSIVARKSLIMGEQEAWMTAKY